MRSTEKSKDYMFRLYKERNFSALINDTFTFFKEGGKSFFKAYFIVNGVILAVLVLLVFIVGKVFFQNLFLTASSPESSKMMDDYFASNEGFFIVAAIVAAILVLILTIASYSFPVLYLKLTEQYPRPTAGQVFRLFRKKLWRIVIFGLLFMITFLPLAFIVGLISMFFFALIITIPIAVILFAAMSCWITLSYFDYLSTDNGYFTSFKNGALMLFKNFWAHMGTTAIFYIIVSVVQSIISFIPYIIGVILLLVDVGTTGEPDGDQFSMLGTMMLVTILVSVVLSYILGNFIFINQGMIYYSCREKSENRTIHSEIDLIGKDFE